MRVQTISMMVIRPKARRRLVGARRARLRCRLIALSPYRHTPLEQERICDIINNIPKGKSVLDVGARDGYLSRLLTGHIASESVDTHLAFFFCRREGTRFNVYRTPPKTGLRRLPGSKDWARKSPPQSRAVQLTWPPSLFPPHLTPSDLPSEINLSTGVRPSLS